MAFLRKICLFLFAVSAFLETRGQQYWMQHGGSATGDEALGICIDAEGSTYTAGYYTGNATFGGSNLSGTGNTDIFLAKTDDQGVFQWTVQAGGPGADRATAVDCDISGNVYIAGFFSDSAVFSNTTLYSTGSQDVFIAKYSSAGVLQWALRAGGSLTDGANGLAIDNNGNVLIIGDYRGSAQFGSTTLSNTNSLSNVFIAKISSSGSFIWVKKGAGTNNDRGLDIACDANGNVYGTGQFSGNFTFDQIHSNSMFNVIFVVKFNASGAEQWFRVAGGATANLANAITCDASNNVLICGDFIGNLIFFGATNFTLSNTFDQRVFIAKYSDSGTLQWAKSAGSDNPISAKSITVDDNGSAFIGGQFQCVLSEYSEVYGSGTFNSIGYQDIFVSRFLNNGDWDYSRNIGAHHDDYCHGLAMDDQSDLYICGSFRDSLIVPTSDQFLSSNLANWLVVGCDSSFTYCSDSFYTQYHGMPANGSADAFMAKCIDPSRQPFDFYKRSGSACNRDALEPCFGEGCPDTISGCLENIVFVDTKTCSNIGPHYFQHQVNSSWHYPLVYGLSWFYHDVSIYLNEGFKHVTVTSPDGCYSSSDSVFANLIGPSPPLITDEYGINVNAIQTEMIAVCAPDTVTITASGYGAGTILWTGPGLGSGSSSPTINVTQSGQFVITYFSSNGCNVQNSVQVFIHPPLPPFDLEMLLDTVVTICSGTELNVLLYDSVENSSASPFCFYGLPYFIQSYMTINPQVENFKPCEAQYSFIINDSGYYTISAWVKRWTGCDTDSFFISRTIYVNALPSPTVDPFQLNVSGSNFYCPSDSVRWIVSGSTGSYSWDGANITGSNSDTVFISQNDFYYVTSVVCDTNFYGCTDCYESWLWKCGWEKPQPTIAAETNILCPFDTILLTGVHYSNGYSTLPCSLSVVVFEGTYEWYGPNGLIAGDSATVKVYEPGTYYFFYNDSDSCNLISTSFTINQFTTPQLMAMDDLVLCEGETLQISILANDTSQIQWLPPLAGSSVSQWIDTPGVYVCEIAACNVVTRDTIEVLPAQAQAIITAERPLCRDDSITLYANDGMATYQWNPGLESTNYILVSSEGVFSLYTIDSFGCVAISDSFVVEMNQIEISVQADTIPIFCSGDSLRLTATPDLLSYLWQPLGDTGSSILVFESGIYTVYTLDSNGCADSSMSPLVQKQPDFIPSDFVGDLEFCQGDSLLLFTSSSGYVEYIWLPDSILAKSITVHKSGIYSMMAIDTHGCILSTDTYNVSMQIALDIPKIQRDTTICRGSVLTLRSLDIGPTPIWYVLGSDEAVYVGERYELMAPDSTTSFYVRNSLDLCLSDSAHILVTVLDCTDPEIPNVLTPNGDGINDLFRFHLNGATCAEMSIFNRWGQLLFYSNHINIGWDGTVTNTGLLASDGTYFYSIRYCRFDGSESMLQGSFTVFRN